MDIEREGRVIKREAVVNKTEGIETKRGGRVSDEKEREKSDRGVVEEELGRVAITPLDDSMG
jgi:hypothetical protein